MSMELSARHSRKYHLLTWAVVVLSGILVGTADILAAFARFYINSGKNPIPPVSKFIASGVFGKPAFKGGAEMIALGLTFHYVIAFLFTIFFFWLYRRWSLLSSNWLVTGIVYGVFIWIIMSQVVVPLSNTPPMREGSTGDKVVAMLILITMIGLPLSFIAKKITAKPTSI